MQQGISRNGGRFLVLSRSDATPAEPVLSRKDPSMFGKKKQPALNLLELVPERLRAFEVDDEGIVTVNTPRFKQEWMRRHLVPRWKNPSILTRLDAVGSHVWMHIDGTRNVADIAAACVDRFGDDIQPVYERLPLFIRAMRDRGFIALRRTDGSVL